MYLFGEEMSLVDSNANYVGDAFSKLDFFVVQDIFFSKPASLPMWFCRPCPAWKKKARSPAPSGGSSGCTRCLSRCAGSRPDWQIIQDVANRLGANWNYQHPSEIMGDCLADADVRRRDLRAAGRLSIAAMAGGGGWNRPAAALHQKIQTSRMARRVVPVPWTEPTEQPDANSICI